MARKTKRHPTIAIRVEGEGEGEGEREGEGVVDYKASGRDFLIRVLGCPPFGAVSEGSPRVHPIPPEAQVQGLPLWVGKRGRWRGVRMLRIRRRVRPEPGRNPSVIWRVRQNVILLSLFAYGSGAVIPFLRFPKSL